MLSGLTKKSKADLPAKDKAKDALDQVKAAYAVTELKILNADGKDITVEHFDGSKAAAPPACDNDVSPANPDEAEKDLLGVTRRATDLSLENRTRLQTASSSGSSHVRGAILLTEDKKMRIHAAKERIASLAPSTLKRYLENGLGRVRSLSRGSQGKPGTPGTTTPPAVLSPTGLKNFDSNAPDQIMENA